MGSILAVKEDGERWKDRDREIYGQSFEFWKLKMEDLLVDKDQWIMVDLGTKPTKMLDEY